MTVLKLRALSLAAVVLIAGGCAYGAPSSPSMKMPSTSTNAMSSCMAMSHDDMMNDRGCVDMMDKMNMSETEKSEMMSCMMLAPETRMKNAACTEMMEKHSAMMTQRNRY